MTNDIKNLTDLLKARQYNPALRPASQQPVLTIQNKIIGMLQSYIIISGLPKASKSTYIGAIAASALLPDYQAHWGIKLMLPKDRKKIGYFDTEMSDYDFYRQIDKILNFADKQRLPDSFYAYSFREDMPGKIRAMIEQFLIDTPDCACIFIDGLLDLCLNYNDEKETRLLTNWFKRITKQYNILMIGVLHLGKGQGETLGHLGSNTDRWAQSTMIVEKNKDLGQFILKPKFLRSSDDFDPIAIMNFNGNWQQIPYIEPTVLNISKPKKEKK